MKLNQIIKVNTVSTGSGTQQVCNNGKGKVAEIKIRDSTHTKSNVQYQYESEKKLIMVLF